MPPPDRPEVLLHKARQDELVVERLLGDRDVDDDTLGFDTSRIAWAKLMARVGEEFPLECPTCGGDIRLIALHQSRGRFGKS
jgi:hypothetical protein